MPLLTRYIEGFGHHVSVENPNTANGGQGTAGERGDVLYRLDVPEIYQNVDGTPTGWGLRGAPPAGPALVSGVPVSSTNVSYPPAGAGDNAFPAGPGNPIVIPEGGTSLVNVR